MKWDTMDGLKIVEAKKWKEMEKEMNRYGSHRSMKKIAYEWKKQQRKEKAIYLKNRKSLKRGL